MNSCDYCSTINSGQDMEITKVSFSRGLGRKEAVHIYNRILVSHKKDEILPFVTTQMDLENSMLSEISHMKK